ncbi:ornithine cyclodeaminase family protein [Rapidithrix thailandica]|uniref:Ornithine cyclodeaminase family protein n=1 Tax=Rapidithrix thailandica TaxID=413964 RepID=A0AAW9S936_9BACT
MTIPYIDAQQINQSLSFPELIAKLKAAFASEITVPLRHHHDFDNPQEGLDSSLLLMPAWQEGKELGVKIVTISPNNSKYNLPSIHGLYLLFDAHKGTPQAIIEGKALTNKRTAAASALASSFLSKEDSQTLLMLGTGSLAPELVKAHASVRPISKVFVYGRSLAKAQAMAESLKGVAAEVLPIEKYEKVLPEADIISTATLSKTPLIHGIHLKEGQHIDLVGSYKPDMREADDQVMLRGTVYIDNWEGAMKETGDIAIPLSTGILQKKGIQGDLFDLCRGKINGRKEAKAITVFKSVGHALEDLTAAQLLIQSLKQ